MNEALSTAVNPVLIMLRMCWMEEVEQSGRKMVWELQQGVERRRRRVGLNTDRTLLLVWISSFSPDIIVISWICLLQELTASYICFL